MLLSRVVAPPRRASAEAVMRFDQAVGSFAVGHGFFQLVPAQSEPSVLMQMGVQHIPLLNETSAPGTMAA